MDKYFLYVQTTRFCVLHNKCGKSALTSTLLSENEASSPKEGIGKTNEVHCAVVSSANVDLSVQTLWSEGTKTLHKSALFTCQCNLHNINLEEELSSSTAGMIHSLADDLPPPGTYFLVVIWLTNGSIPLPEDSIELYGAFARLETLHAGRICIVDVTKETFDVNGSHSKKYAWDELLCSSPVFLHSIPLICESRILWTGSMKIRAEQVENDILLPEVALRNENSASLMHKFQQECPVDWLLQLDRELEVLCTISLQSIPLHLLSQDKVLLCCSDKAQEEILKSVCLDLDQQDLCFLGIFRYGFIARHTQEEMTKTEDWVDYVGNTNNLNDDARSSRQKLNRRKLFILLVSSEDQSRKLIVSILEDKDIFQRPHMELWCQSILNQMVSVQQEALPSVSCPSVCPELLAWSNEEFKGSAKGSLKRFQSSEKTLAGIPLSAKQKSSDQRGYEEFSSYFQKDGKPVCSGLKPIPLASDRMFKKMCSEDTVKELAYHEAKAFTGHGIEYCLDSQLSLRLDNRLMRIQNRYIVNDTRCSHDRMAKEETSRRKTCKNNGLSLPSESRKGRDVVPHNWNLARKGKKSKILTTDERHEYCKQRSETVSQITDRVVKVDDSSNAGPETDLSDERSFKMLSRSERHKKRLRLITEAVVQKYGKIARSHKCFQNCVSRLYELSKSFLKDLSTSKGLVEEMKRVAKLNVNQVVQFELKRGNKI